MRALHLPVAILALSGCAAMENETDIPLSDVPGAAMIAARESVPGITITGAELEAEGGKSWYELSGEAGGKSYEIEVSATGEILDVDED